MIWLFRVIFLIATFLGKLMAMSVKIFKGMSVFPFK